MFNNMSNTMFNKSKTPCLTNEHIDLLAFVMDETMIRIYKAARDLHGIDGQTPLANAIDELPQTVNNWEKRGASKQGMIKIQEILGISIDYIKGKVDGYNKSPPSKLTHPATKSGSVSAFISGVEIHSIEHQLLDTFKKLSLAHKDALLILANKLLIIDRPDDASLTGRKSNKQMKESQ